MNEVKIAPMSKKKYLRIPLNRIRVLDTRNNDKVHFADAIQHAATVGLVKPIVVNEHSLHTDGYYELVAGESLFRAHVALKRDRIVAEVIDCDSTMAHLLSSAMTIVRPELKPLTFAKEIKRMKDCGIGLERISQIVGHRKKRVADNIRLIETGEERLIAGVEQGHFDIPFALIVARSVHKNVRSVLMDAFDAGLIDWTTADRVRLTLERRLKEDKQPSRGKTRIALPRAGQHFANDMTETIRQALRPSRACQARVKRILNALDGVKRRSV